MEKFLQIFSQWKNHKKPDNKAKSIEKQIINIEKTIRTWQNPKKRSSLNSFKKERNPKPEQNRLKKSDSKKHSDEKSNRHYKKNIENHLKKCLISQHRNIVFFSKSANIFNKLKRRELENLNPISRFTKCWRKIWKRKQNQSQSQEKEKSSKIYSNFLKNRNIFFAKKKMNENNSNRKCQEKNNSSLPYRADKIR